MDTDSLRPISADRSYGFFPRIIIVASPLDQVTPVRSRAGFPSSFTWPALMSISHPNRPFARPPLLRRSHLSGSPSLDTDTPSRPISKSSPEHPSSSHGSPFSRQPKKNRRAAVGVDPVSESRPRCVKQSVCPEKATSTHNRLFHDSIKTHRRGLDSIPRVTLPV